ncbi:MAG TPA: DUF2855 family protein [Burkholderiales bacterium]
MPVQLWVRKDDLSETRLVEPPDAALAAGAVRIDIDAFALTANNVTYAAFGEAMKYWQFYPAGEDGWGCVPVWGFGVVRESRAEGVAAGERLWGYWPMADTIDLLPARVDAAGFSDGAPHRAELHPVYNRVLRCATDPGYDPSLEAEQMLLRPLFGTSFLIDDFLAEQAFFGAQRVLLSSASSKTAYALAWLLARRGGVEVIGLTSAGNRAFVERLGCYSRVLPYEAPGTLEATAPLVYVDFAGNADLRRAIHEGFPALAYSCAVGGTHWEALGGGKGLPGPRPELFFAPAQGRKRAAQWGAQAFAERVAGAMRGFFAAVRRPGNPWLVVRRAQGPTAAATAWRELLAGRTPPEAGLILSLRDAA